MTTLHIDIESRSAVDLKKTGVYVYAEDPSTDIWCVAYAFGDEPARLWRLGEAVPPDIFEHVLSGGICVAHNANFERVMWKHILWPRYGWPEPAIEQWRCTMVMAYAMALPGKLDDAAAALGLEHRKDDAGGRLMMQMSRPRKVNADGSIVWWDAPEKIDRLIKYCIQDVEVERALEKRLRPLKPSELALWHLDQRVNDRGVYVDVALCEAAKKIVAATAARLDRAMADATDYAVSACSNRNQLIAWVREQGVATESIAKDQVEEILARKDLPPRVRTVLELRQQAAKASVAKIDALLAGTSRDGRARGLLQFSAASTGRWAGRRFQPQNIVRPEDKFPVDLAIDSILKGYAEALFGDDLLHVVSQCLRGMIKAPPGKKIVAADYANIEGRMLAWLAGEEWKLQAFRDFDAGDGPDLYKVTASEILGINVKIVNKDQRQAYGKVPELALGYQGGVGAFQTMAVTYGVDVTDAEAERIRDLWRAKHPRTKQLWYDLEAAAIAAVREPGSTHHAANGRVIFRVAGSFLFMCLPSGRFLAYAYPEIQNKEMPWCDDRGHPVWKPSLSYMGVNSYTRKWERCFAYGGLLAENADSASSRDILADAMPRLEAAGYAIILTVHDEIVCEVPEDFGSLEEMIAIMTALPKWADGLPVAAAGFEGERYRK